jgi:excisionase family DNA binding protein
MTKATRKLRIYSALEVANICGVVNQTAINWIRNGHLKAFITPGGQYRVYEEDLCGFLIKRGMSNSIDALRGTEGGNTAAPDETETALIIDHDRQASGRLKEQLESAFPKFEILQAYDGFDAGRLLYQQKPGMVFLNIDLPGINIFNLARKFREDPALGYPQVIALVKGREEGSAVWADAYLPQPFALEKVREIAGSLGRPARTRVTA